MTADALDPVIHAPARLRIVATLAALPDGASLSFTRLQDMLDLTPGNLITHLRKLEDAGYLTSETTGNGRASRTSSHSPARAAQRSTPTPTRCATCSAACRRQSRSTPNTLLDEEHAPHTSGTLRCPQPKRETRSRADICLPLTTSISAAESSYLLSTGSAHEPRPELARSQQWAPSWAVLID